MRTTNPRSLTGYFPSMYTRWQGMQQRCYNPQSPCYKNYGARGIKVCGRWLESFDNFLFDMGLPPTPDHSIDRVNNDGDYEPENCRWATAKEQAANKRPPRKRGQGKPEDYGTISNLELVFNPLPYRVANYRAMCKLLNQPIKAGNAKKAQVAWWQRHFTWMREGNAFVVTAVIPVEG